MTRRKRKNWIQKAIKRPGRVERYIRRKYGSKAFTRDGDIKMSYIDKAIRDLKSRPKSKRPKGLLNALYLAKRLKKWARNR
ncbi:MAG: capsid protein VP2 [Candidatus Methanospirareceae archaeon]